MTTDNILQEVTLEGQRWDSIALKVYGSPTMMGSIIEANPEVPRYDLFPAGIVLNIPIIDRAVVKTDMERLPPWKRD